jgi:glycerol uptake facilitator-like aquaporin
MRDAVARHWPEYLMEAAGLGIFMLSAGGFAIVLFHPASPVALAVTEPLGRRVLMGCAMGLTAVCLIYSPWGQQSGAHFNPAVTLTFLRLGKIAAPDAFFYVLAQIAGGVAGILTVALASRGLLANPTVNYVVTVPGATGARAAFGAEPAMSLGLMSVVLARTRRGSHGTPAASSGAGTLDERAVAAGARAPGRRARRGAGPSHGAVACGIDGRSRGRAGRRRRGDHGRGRRRSAAFYSSVLFFDKVSDVQASGPEVERLLGVVGVRVRVRLRAR